MNVVSAGRLPAIPQQEVGASWGSWLDEILKPGVVEIIAAPQARADELGCTVSDRDAGGL